MSDIEIGRSKRARRAYAFDDIAVVPSRRTRDPQDVSVKWTIDAFTFDMPVLAAPMDSVVSPETAIQIGRQSGSQKHAQSWLELRIRDLILPLVLPLGRKAQERMFGFRADLTPLAQPVQ